MDKIFIIKPNENLSVQLKSMLCSALEGKDYTYVKDDYENLTNKKLLFVMELNEIGYDIPMLNFILSLKLKKASPFQGSVGGILVHSSSELYTKRACQDIIFISSLLGCSFLGHPIVECIEDYKNFTTWQKSLSLNLSGICNSICSDLSLRLLDFKKIKYSEPLVSVIYSTPNKASNTLNLWHICSNFLRDIKVNEILIENGKIEDCKGCSYTACVHYGINGGCFYGGIINSDILPLIEKSDALVWLCPNYNDSITANLTALINRLTILTNKKINFERKQIYGIIVSGNSGSDSVAKQLIGSLNINKGFFLPNNFCLTAIANDPNAIYKVKNIQTLGKTFAENIYNNLVLKE